MNIYKLLFFLLVSIFTTIIGCAKVGIVKRAELAGLEQDNSSKVCIARAGGVGSAVRHEITIDGLVFAKLYPSQYFCTLLPSGQHSIGVEGETSIGLSLVPKETYFFTVYALGSYSLYRVTETDFNKFIGIKYFDFEDISSRSILEND